MCWLAGEKMKEHLTDDELRGHATNCRCYAMQQELLNNFTGISDFKVVDEKFYAFAKRAEYRANQIMAGKLDPAFM
jgi:hypothetical protein